MTRDPETRTKALLSTLLVVAVLLAFGRALTCGFVDYDDPAYVSMNDRVQSGLSPDNVRWALTTNEAGNWHPLTWVSLQLDASLFGPRPFGFHLTNIVLHLASVLLLFLWLCRVTGSVGRSGFAAALFALHPLRVESVAWVSERKDVLSALLWILGLWAYLRYVTRPRRRSYLLLVLVFVLGLLAKPMLVTFPAALLLMDVWPLRRWTPGARPAPDRRWRLPGRLLLEKVPLVVLSVTVAGVTMAVQRQSGAVAEIHEIALLQRIANALHATAAYLGKLVWPSPLFAPYPYALGGRTLAEALTALLVLGLISALVWVVRRAAYPVVGWLWYLITLAPVSGIVTIGSAPMADRYTYLPQLGLAWVVAWGIPDLHKWRRRGRPGELPGRREKPGAAPTFAAAAIAALLVVLSFRQTGYWKDSFAFWTHTVAVSPNNYMAEMFLANNLAARGEDQTAVTHFRQALQIGADEPDLLINYAFSLSRLGRKEEAERLYRRALAIDPTLPEARNNLANLLLAAGRLEEAVTEYREAIRARPAYPEAHFNLSLALTRLGRVEEGIGECEEALRIRPDFEQARTMLAQWREYQARRDGK